jgi:hypothetical protein
MLAGRGGWAVSYVCAALAIYLSIRCYVLQGRIDYYRAKETALTDAVFCFSRQNYENIHEFMQTLKGILHR